MIFKYFEIWSENTVVIVSNKILKKEIKSIESSKTWNVQTFG